VKQELTESWFVYIYMGLFYIMLHEIYLRRSIPSQKWQKQSPFDKLYAGYFTGLLEKIGKK
jgi:hypothetical protein